MLTPCVLTPQVRLLTTDHAPDVPHVPGRLLVMAGESGQVELHDIRGDRHLQTLHQHSGEVRCVRLCPPATHLMSGEICHGVLVTSQRIQNYFRDDNQCALEVLQIYFLICSTSCM